MSTTQTGALLARIFAEAGNALKSTSKGFQTGHEPVHQSKSGNCVKIDSEKNRWYCTSCNTFGDEVAAVMSLRGLSREDARAYITATFGDEAREKQSKSSQATELVKLAESVALWHTPDFDAWATFPVNGHSEHANIRTKGFRRWLVRQYYESHKSTPGSQAVQDALGVLEGRAVHDGKEHPVFLRIAEHAGRVYLDLCNETWEVVEVESPAGG